MFKELVKNALEFDNTAHNNTDNYPKPLVGDLREVIDPQGLCAWDWPEVCDPYELVDYFDVIPTGSIVLVTQILEDNKKPKKKSFLKRILERLDMVNIPDESYLIMDSQFITHWVAKDSLSFSTRKL